MSSTTTTSALMKTYQRLPLRILKGKGSYVWDDQDIKYLDYTSGIATCNLGHVPDQVQAKLSEQLENLWHCSNLYQIPVQEALAEKLASLSCFDQVFFCNSGAEANEAAIKLAKKYAKDHQKPERTEIVTFSNSFHGRTGSTMAATAQTKIHNGFTPLTPGFTYLPFNQPEAIEQIDTNKTAGVLLELVQGEGGVHPADIEWVKALYDYCKQADILFMVDEIQTGIGRTGSLFVYEQYDIEPDAITLAKGLGSGFPIGALLAKNKAADSFSPGTHGSTFGGNPLAATAGLATLEQISDPVFFNGLKEKYALLTEALIELAENNTLVKEVRGKGFLIGMEVENKAAIWVEKLREKQILVLTAGEHVVRILPPLTTKKEELFTFIEVITAIAADIEEKEE
ncbi:aspartate aminotransferase family protein [Oceanobacillus jeddahense]|uniref:Acetylornithine aminotransferase n=1 Tax=Oceanobacillus jeddahense TaxID=1462527 RepID=A0ABY5JXH4_9BACI|nr:aspartate aminotransferase family protein [Oceanobacillus jeddahense]UUI05105.1 aspartate aminotransferase family protein [Oceanobacillus jeddahense]